MNSDADIRRGSGIQFRFLDGCTSNKVPRTGRTTFFREAIDRKLKKRREVGNLALLAEYFKTYFSSFLSQILQKTAKTLHWVENTEEVYLRQLVA